MDQSVGKIPGFDGSDYSYWKIRMSAFLQSQHSSVWDICQRADFEVLEDRITQLQQWEHEANWRLLMMISCVYSPTSSSASTPTG